MNVTVFYVGSSLLAPLREAEREIERRYRLGLRVAAYNFGAPLAEDAWRSIDADVSASEIVFVLHVTDSENATRMLALLKRYESSHAAVVVINCMPELMRRTRMGRLRFGSDASDASVPTLVGGDEASDGASNEAKLEFEADAGVAALEGARGRASRLVRSVGAWMGEQVKARRASRPPRHTQYLRLIEHLPSLLRLVPNAGRLRDAKHYLNLFCYFLQPTPANICSMLLYAVKHYARDERLARVEIKIQTPEAMPAVGIYHPDAEKIFKTFKEYHAWYERRSSVGESQRRSVGGGTRRATLAPEQTVGLLLMRPQIVSGTHAHYDALIRAIESEGLAVLPAISTFMDNREACAQFFVESDVPGVEGVQARARVSQVLSLTGFSFVGGPAMNDSEAAVEFLRELNCPFRSAVSLDVQTVESWEESWTGLNPVQAGMQVAIPEIDGATEPFVFGGIRASGAAPVALEDRCRRVARRLVRWNRLQTCPRSELKLALVVFCFPPNKGNIGTAAELDVFPSVWETLRRLRAEGYAVDVPESADALRERLTGGNSESFGANANVAYRMTLDEYRRCCPYVAEIEAEWGAAPGSINSFGGELLIQGVQLGNVLVAVQPTFGYEGDPMRLLMARSGAPHHGFAALYTYLEKIFETDAVVHVGTHGALEFMPGKQVGLSSKCWPDRLMGELPNVYLYSVNNPSEGTIARRRSYAELISYLTPPVADAGVYRELSTLKELLTAYRQTSDEAERQRLYAIIEETSGALHFELQSASASRSSASVST